MNDTTPATTKRASAFVSREPACLVLEDGRAFRGEAYGATGETFGEAVFSTGMTGYQETLTDPSFAGQIITFTFPHIGNVGANLEDVEAQNPFALGCIVREDVTAPSNFRAVERLDGWMKRHARIGLAGVDTRALTRRIRAGGAPNGVVAHSPDGTFDLDAFAHRVVWNRNVQRIEMHLESLAPQTVRIEAGDRATPPSDRVRDPTGSPVSR